MKKLPKEFVDSYASEVPPWGPVGYITYKRTYARLIERTGRTEEWHEHCARLVNGLLELGAPYTEDEAYELYDVLFYMKGSVSGRAHWQLGTETVRKIGADSLQNCWHVACRDTEAFCFTFDELMLGGGVGYNIQAEHVYSLPTIAFKPVIEHVDSTDCDFIVPDNREGWVELLRLMLRSYTKTGRSVRYSTRCIRPAGARINGFGGVASGANALVTAIGMISKVLSGAHRRKLKPIECLDIMNIIGKCVIAGNVRRSAQIALGDPTDTEYLSAKNWGSGKVPAWRAMSNNSIVTSTIADLPEMFWNGYNGSGEPYGLINLDACRTYGRLIDGVGYRPDPDVIGVNPCVTSDTWVMTDEGPRMVRSLLDKTFTAVVDGKTFQATAFWKSGTKEVGTLRSKSGLSLRLTPDHKVKTSHGEWVEAGNLKKGDKVVIHNHAGTRWGGDDFDRAYVVGHILGDGTHDNGTPICCLWKSDEGFNSVQLQLDKHLTTLHRRSDQGWTEYDGKLRFKCVALRNEVCLFYGPLKDLSDAVEEQSSSFYSGFLSGWFDTDGHVEGSTSKGVRVCLTSTKLANLERAQRMLLRLGIKSTIYGLREAGESVLPGGYLSVNATYRLQVSGVDAVLFAREVGFCNSRKQADLESRLVEYKRGPYQSPFEVEVASYTVDGVEPVYDCTVDEVHAFDANGFYVHNCAEITLCDREACNLAEVYLPNIKTLKEFKTVVKLLYIACKTISRVPFSNPISEEISQKNHRIGIGLTGWMASPKWHDAEKLTAVYRDLERCDRHYSKLMGLNTSIKLTTVKPSGTLSLLPDNCPPGVHAAFGRHLIRRIRFAASDPLVDVCIAHGYHVEPVRQLDGSTDDNTLVVSFPLSYGSQTTCEEDITVFDQLKQQQFLQTYWADNSVSATHYFRRHELEGIQDWLASNYTNGVKTASFLLASEHGFAQAPLEKITEEQYNALLARTRPITSVDDKGGFEIGGMECAGGACPIK